jgi:hypothetical protein
VPELDIKTNQINEEFMIDTLPKTIRPFSQEDFEKFPVICCVGLSRNHVIFD